VLLSVTMLVDVFVGPCTVENSGVTAVLGIVESLCPWFASTVTRLPGVLLEVSDVVGELASVPVTPRVVPQAAPPDTIAKPEPEG
jgi:hypothetical protein